MRAQDGVNIRLVQLSDTDEFDQAFPLTGCQIVDRIQNIFVTQVHAYPLDTKLVPHNLRLTAKTATCLKRHVPTVKLTCP